MSARLGSNSRVMRRPSGGAAGEPDGAVSAERADLEDVFGAVHAGEEMEELALIWRNVDGRQVSGNAGGEGGVERGIGGDEEIGQVTINSCPVVLRH